MLVHASLHPALAASPVCMRIISEVFSIACNPRIMLGPKSPTFHRLSLAYPLSFTGSFIYMNLYQPSTFLLLSPHPHSYPPLFSHFKPIHLLSSHLSVEDLEPILTTPYPFPSS